MCIRDRSYSKKYAKYLTAEQEKQLAAGKKINTSNIKNANVKKIIDQYNVNLQNAMNSYTAATQQLTAAQEAEAEMCIRDRTQGLSESQTKLVLSSKALSDAQRIAILMGQGTVSYTHLDVYKRQEERWRNVFDC